MTTSVCSNQWPIYRIFPILCFKKPVHRCIFSFQHQSRLFSQLNTRLTVLSGMKAVFYSITPSIEAHWYMPQPFSPFYFATLSRSPGLNSSSLAIERFLQNRICLFSSMHFSQVLPKTTSFVSFIMTVAATTTIKLDFWCRWSQLWLFRLSWTWRCRIICKEGNREPAIIVRYSKEWTTF